MASGVAPTARAAALAAAAFATLWRPGNPRCRVISPAGVVSTTRLPGGLVRARGVGEPAEGAETVQPTLEDAYLLLLRRDAEAEDADAA